MTDNEKMLDDIAAFLKASGWNPVVIGGWRIEQPDLSRKFHFEFVVGFAGTPPVDLKKPEVIQS